MVAMAQFAGPGRLAPNTSLNPKWSWPISMETAAARYAYSSRPSWPARDESSSSTNAAASALIETSRPAARLCSEPPTWTATDATNCCWRRNRSRPREHGRGDLKELWSSPAQSSRITEILPASRDQPATIVMYPAVGLDGVPTGFPRHQAGQPSLRAPTFNPAICSIRAAPVGCLFWISQRIGATVGSDRLAHSAVGNLRPAPGRTSSAWSCRERPALD